MTLREQTEWTELVDAGVNVLVGANRHDILRGVNEISEKKCNFNEHFYGSANAAEIIVEDIIGMVPK